MVLISIGSWRKLCLGPGLVRAPEAVETANLRYNNSGNRVHDLAFDLYQRRVD
jgi:hypothetical protein